ncbi:MAG: TonB family protein [Bacteroidales bacterium]|nr:TonB family protein [Bacteroidales bacterium]
MQQEKKDKAISAVSTALIMLCAVLLCSWIGYKLPNPPIEEEGMGVAGEVLGEIEGFGNNDNATFDDNSAAAPAASTPNESYTTGQEPTPVAKTPKQEDKPTPATKPEPTKTTSENTSTTPAENTQPATNPNATFKGRKNGNGSEGKGTATGSGQAGSPDGTQGAQGGSGKGNGASYSLGGRSLRGTLPTPSYTSPKDGNVVVEIWVNQDGVVVDVSAPAKGSYNYDNAMVEAAKKAARSAHFNADRNATEKQKGTITYKFRHVG